MSMSDNLAGIPQDDDFTLADPETYVDSGNELLPAGTYDFHLVDYTPVQNDQNDPAKVTAIDLDLQVIGSKDAKFLKRRTGRIRIFTKKFERKPGIYASGLGDFIRGITDTERWMGQEQALAILNRAKDSGVAIQLRLDWEAFDKKGYDEQGGGGMERGSVEQKELRKRATVKGMGAFPAFGDDTHRDSVEGPISGEDIQARLVIRTTVPQSKRRTLPSRL